MNAKTLPACAGALLLTVSIAACSRGNAGTADASINTAVEQKLAADPALQGAKITASTQNGVVTLTGSVADETARMDAAQDARVPGVSQVNNAISTDSAVAPAASDAMAGNSAMMMRAQPSQPARTAPRAPKSAAPEPAPRMSAVAPVQIEKGTTVEVRLSQGLSTEDAAAGNTFHGTVAEPILVNGQIAVPKGAAISGRVVAADSAGKFKGQSRLELTLAALSYNGQNYTLHTNTFSREASSRSTRSTETIGGGAAVGALIGALAGHGKGAAIGAATGAGAGTAAQLLTKPAQVELPAESVVKFSLSAPVQVVPAAAVN